MDKFFVKQTTLLHDTKFYRAFLITKQGTLGGVFVGNWGGKARMRHRPVDGGQMKVFAGVSGAAAYDEKIAEKIKGGYTVSAPIGTVTREGGWLDQKELISHFGASIFDQVAAQFVVYPGDKREDTPIKKAPTEDHPASWGAW